MALGRAYGGHDAITGHQLTKTLTLARGDDVASAATLTLGDGNMFDVTGNATISGIATKAVGTIVWLQFDGLPTLTHSASFDLPGSANISVQPGDVGVFEEISAGGWRCNNYQNYGSPPLHLATQAEMEAETAARYPDAAILNHHPGIAKGWVKFNQSATMSVWHNVTSVTWNSLGNYTVNWDTDFSSADYVVVAHVLLSADSVQRDTQILGQTAGTVNLEVVTGSTNTELNVDSIFVAAFGDQ